MIKLTVNQTSAIEVEFKKDEILMNGEIFDWDLAELKPGTFHILKDAVSYNVEILKADKIAKSFLIKINGRNYNVEAKDEFDLLLEKLGMNKITASQINQLKAPMPGLIHDIKVSEGQEVKKGDILLILEAMKMENVLKAPADAVIKSIKIKKGESVEKNQILIVF